MIKRAADTGSLIMGILTCGSTFLGLTCVFYPDTFGIVSPRTEIATAVKLMDDGSLPPMTEREMWSEETLAKGDWRTE